MALCSPMGSVRFLGTVLLMLAFACRPNLPASAASPVTMENVLAENGQFTLILIPVASCRRYEFPLTDVTG